MAMTNHFSKERKKALADAEKLKNQQEKDLRNDYDTQIFETKRGYEDEYRENAVQKAINERQVAESMANMGLSDSGLNRTQQTAVQLSYANNNAAIDKAKRQATDSLNLQKTRDLASLNQNWLAKKESINQTYDNMEADYAAKVSAARYQYLSDLAKTQNQGHILVDGSEIAPGMQGTLEENGITVRQRRDKDGNFVGYTYYDTKSGKSTDFEIGENPFAGWINKDLYNEEGKYDASRAFQGGYQPKYKDGVLLKGVEYADGENKGWTVTKQKYGNNHAVFSDGENYYVWDKYANDYEVICKVSENKHWKITK